MPSARSSPPARGQSTPTAAAVQSRSRRLPGQSERGRPRPPRCAPRRRRAWSARRCRPAARKRDTSTPAPSESPPRSPKKSSSIDTGEAALQGRLHCRGDDDFEGRARVDVAARAPATRQVVETRQRRPIEFAADSGRQRVEHADVRRHHVRRQMPRQFFPERRHVDGAAARGRYDEGHEALAVALTLDRGRGLRHAAARRQSRFDRLELDAIAAQLDLRVQAPVAEEASVGVAGRPVAGAVDPSRARDGAGTAPPSTPAGRGSREPEPRRRGTARPPRPRRLPAPPRRGPRPRRRRSGGRWRSPRPAEPARARPSPSSRSGHSR